MAHLPSAAPLCPRTWNGVWLRAHRADAWRRGADDPAALLHLIACGTGQGLLVLKHRAEIAHVELAAARFEFEKCSTSSIRCPPIRLPTTVPRAIPVMLAILVIPCFARLDRDFDFRAVTCPLDRA